MLRSGLPTHLVDAVTEVMQSTDQEGDEPLSPDVYNVTKKEPRSFATWVNDNLSAFR